MNTMENTALQQPRKYATLLQINYQRKWYLKEIMEEIRLLELRFAGLDKCEHPAEWFDVQDRLGYAYRQLMKLVVRDRINGLAMCSCVLITKNYQNGKHCIN